MANTNAPFGFRPIRRYDGAAWSGNLTTCKMQITAGALNRGDCVKQLADGTVAVSAAADGHLMRGVFEGCHYLSAALGYPIWSNYWPGSGAVAGTLVDAFIIDDPNVVFEAMANAGPIALADIGSNVDITVTASTTGFSKWSVGAPTTSGSTNYPFKVIGLGNNGVFTADGYDSSSANNVVELLPNDWFLKGPAIGI